uniref:Uncharacterized protein n=1 Tax=Oryza sativa subsp. japonica TaxID=39947 RepID=Q6K9F3_ORYSJ|nr:hypothetical protein [Oryza sativa Japonica Group]BAD21582.1 hypothetical protein [Oryza sativa Japonica Group]
MGPLTQLPEASSSTLHTTAQLWVVAIKGHAASLFLVGEEGEGGGPCSSGTLIAVPVGLRSWVYAVILELLATNWDEIVTNLWNLLSLITP